MRIVLALGGNALGDTAEEQNRSLEGTAKAVAEIIEAGNEVIITHGNGPQVGMINLAMSTAAEGGVIKAAMPFPECGAMSQGYIGFQLEKKLRNELNARGIKKDVATIVTQVLVSESDPAFENPTKPIGLFYTKEQAEAIAEEKGYFMKEDAGRGYRRVVPSPKPIDVIEKNIIKLLSDNGDIVIACGGGGVPVILEDGALNGVSAVIDKDFAAAKLADLTNADMLVILTAVDKVCINYNKPNQKKLDAMSCSEAETYISEGQFAPGSMLPKVQAAVSFAEAGKKAVIASLADAGEAVKGSAGTVICG